MDQPTNNQSPEFEAPQPEVLEVQSDNVAEAAVAEASASSSAPAGESDTPQPSTKPVNKFSYRPSHKATFVGLGVVIAILAANAALIAFLMKNQTDAMSDPSQQGVTLSPQVLDKLGISRNPVGNKGTTLTVGPDAKFNGKMEIGGDTSIAGQLTLNNKMSAADASLTKLQAGDVQLQQLNVNGDGTISTLNLRRDLNVVGSTRLQGPVTMSQTLSVNNNMNVISSLSVGGTLSVRTFEASSLTSGSTLTIGGHVITRGNAPRVSAGSGVGQNGTASISGNDVAGTVSVGVGTGSRGGTLAEVSFVNKYDNIPHVVVSTIGGGLGSVYITRNADGFSIGVNGAVPAGGYAFDYIVMQ